MAGISLEDKLPSSPRITISNSKTLLVFVSGGSELIHVIHDIFMGVGLRLLCTVVECGNIIYRSSSPQIRWLDAHSLRAVLILDALSYFWATLDVTPWLFDLFVVAFIERLFILAYKKSVSTPWESSWATNVAN
ncbi:hypothetical protein ACFX2I_021062 [Malus domestica]